METKLSKLKQKMKTGDLAGALRIASKFQELGKQRDAILDAYLAHTNPRWILCLGKDIEELKNLGKRALIDRFGN